MNLTKHNLS